MASRLWNQITSANLLKHGTLRTFSSQSAVNRTVRRHALESGVRHFSKGKDLKSGPQPQGRFVRNAPGPATAADLALRPALRYRAKYGAQIVSRNAAEANRSSCRCKPYHLRDRSELVPDERHIKCMKARFVREASVAYLQPHNLPTFCSKEVRSFGREDVKPPRIIIGKPIRRHMSSSAHHADSESVASEIVASEKPSSDAVSVHSDHSMQSHHSHASQQSAGSVASTATSIASVDGSIVAAVEAEPVGSVASLDAAIPPSQNSPHLIKAAPTSERAHIGYNFTQYIPSRPYSTFFRPVTAEPTTSATMQTRGLISKECCPPDCPKKKKKHPPKLCGDIAKEKRRKDKYPEDVHKHHGRWDKCECCPEMLPCDQTTCVYTYPFPCPCDEYPVMCPIDCPPPCEFPPPPEMPLCRPPKCPVYQKTRECSGKCSPRSCVYVEPRALPPLPKPTCPCVEPHLPCVNPPMRFKRKRVYQCMPECRTSRCPPDDSVVPPKKLPPIVPGVCPCIEPEILDVPPLPRLNMQAYQKVKECKPKVCKEPEQPKCLERKTLPKIKSDCVCIEPPPLKHVKLVRLPPICVCPEPPDPKCFPEKCPPRADEVCKWKFPKKKLKNYWCPNCKIPKTKYKWCKCHTRGQKSCKDRSYMKHKRCFATCACAALAEDGGAVCAARPFAAFGASAVSTGLPGTTILKRLNVAAPLSTRHLHATALRTRQRKKYGHAPETEASLLGEKKRCRKKECPKICGTVCCEPPARTSCEPRLLPLCCKAKRSPYPAFSEYGEFSQLLTCECKETMPYLQPNKQHSPEINNIIHPAPPKYRVIDPVPEEHCVLHDLCRPRGHTYTCETFHRGEVVPITQYECFSPHRLPCCERDQICDFGFRKSERYCTGNKKEREFYRCECACPKPKPCPPKMRFKLDTLASKIRKRGRRHYSTFARRPVEAAKPSALLAPTALPSASASCSAGFHSGAALMRRPRARAGGQDMCRPKCPRKCKAWGKRKTCGKPICKAKQPLALQGRKKKKISSGISNRLKQHFKKAIECSGAKGRRHILVQEAKCAAKRVGMKLVPDHDKCCKKRKIDCYAPGLAKPKCGVPECKRPKNVCCECDPRYEVDECRKKRWVAECCEMPTRLTGAEFRAMQPPCCKMPLPWCNRDCMRVRAACDKAYIPCCVTESPFPAFSDCHPPFKRPVLSECQVREIKAEEASMKIDHMLRHLGSSKNKRKEIGGPCHYSTATKAALLPPIAEEAARAEKTEESHAPAHCKCAACLRRVAATRDVQTALHASSNGIDNVPPALPMSKDDIFKQVDTENLISLAPAEMTPLEKEKRGKPGPTAAGTNDTVTRSYSTAKPKMDDELAARAREEAEEELKKVLPAPRAKVVTLSSTSDLIYLLEDGQNVINLSPKQCNAGEKVKVVPHPVCTHIMLDSGELLTETQYQLMNTIMPMQKRIYLPYGLSHEEYTAVENRTTKAVQEELGKVLVKKRSS